MQGFLDHPRNGLSADPARLREIYDSSLILLYRLLFILYAESRDLLPVRESTDYRDPYSLHAIKHDVERNPERGRTLLPTSATLWPRLTELFGIIANGSPPLKAASLERTASRLKKEISSGRPRRPGCRVSRSGTVASIRA